MTSRVSVGDVELAYDIIGTRGRPLVLVMGIGAQRVFWHDDLCQQFVRAGFHVVRFDNRDVGESTHLSQLPTPDARKLLAQRMLGRIPEAPYTLSDMARDTAQLIRELRLERAHLVGVSLGGMVAQHVAIEHPDQLRSMTAIMTSPGGRRYLPEPAALSALFMKKPTDAADAGAQIAKTFAVLAGRQSVYPHDDARMRALGELAYTRGYNPRGFLRQFAAIMATPDRRAALRNVRVPSLVIHGSKDPMFPLRAGRDLANLIPGGTWLPIASMGHNMPEPLWPTLVSAIAHHAARADARV